MKITIDNKNYELKFGIKFINSLDHLFGLTEQGLEFGMGTLPAVTALQSYDPAALAKIIACASVDNLSVDMVSDYIENLNEDELEKLFSEVLTDVKESTMVNFQWKKLTGKALVTSKKRTMKNK